MKKLITNRIFKFLIWLNPDLDISKKLTELKNLEKTVRKDVDWLIEFRKECDKRLIIAYNHGCVLEKNGFKFDTDYFKSKNIVETNIILPGIDISDLNLNCELPHNNI